MHARVVVLLAALACACFSDPPPVDESDTTGPSCSVGANMCPCTDGGACDEGLLCHGPLQLCYDPGCMPGTDGCTCDGERCDEGLRCNAGLCGMREDPGSDATTDVSESTTADPTTAADAASEVDSGTDTELIDPCRMCIAGEATTCGPDYVPCSMSPPCLQVSTCIIMDGMPAAECCTGTATDDAWNMYMDCALVACGDECSSYDVRCGGG